MEAKQRENLVKKCEDAYTKAMNQGQLRLALDVLALQFSIEREEPDPQLGGKQE